MEENKAADELAGTVLALSSAIRALIRTHPNPEALIAALNFEHQETLALISAAPIRERAVETFHTVWTSVGPSDEGG